MRKILALFLFLTSSANAGAPVLFSGTAAKWIASGLQSAGVIITDSTGLMSIVAPSTSGNVLTSNGSTWTSAAASGGGYFVCSATITGSTTATRTSTSLGPFTGAVGINAPVVQLAGTGGTCQTTDADNFSFTVNNVVAGTYRVSLDFSSAVGASKIAQFAINDGTSTIGSAQVYNGSAIDGSYWPIHVEGFVTYGGTANKTFVPYGRSDSGALGINPVDGNGQMFFSLTRTN